jgi:hypothetical protein
VRDVEEAVCISNGRIMYRSMRVLVVLSKSSHDKLSLRRHSVIAFVPWQSGLTRTPIHVSRRCVYPLHGIVFAHEIALSFGQLVRQSN